MNSLAYHDTGALKVPRAWSRRPHVLHLTDNEKEPTPHRPDFYLGVIGLPIE